MTVNSETLIGGDRHRYDLDPTTRVGFATLYGPFASSWRITATTSLFTYPKGKSTSSYVVKGFPITYAALYDLSAAGRRRMIGILARGCGAVLHHHMPAGLPVFGSPVSVP